MLIVSWPASCRRRFATANDGSHCRLSKLFSRHHIFLRDTKSTRMFLFFTILLKKPPPRQKVAAQYKRELGAGGPRLADQFMRIVARICW
jgi:hypothetical protein